MITYTCNPDVECGCSKNSAVLSKIVGGEQAIVNSWGWAVSLRLFDSHICGGSILSKYYIITASHCVLSIPSLRYASIHVGINTLSQTGQVRKIAQSFIHADYDSATHENDIAILRLTTPLDLSDLTVSTICLPNSTSALPQSVEYPLPGSTLIAIGWGVLSSESNRVSQTLQQVTLTAVPKTASTCVRSLSNSSEQFCASAQGKDTCQGDSGGAVMLFLSNQRWQLVGVTSFGVGCASPFYAGIYTRVSYYVGWINCILGTNHTYCPTRITKLDISEANNLLNYNYLLVLFTFIIMYLLKN